jgi:hypothetical protein
VGFLFEQGPHPPVGTFSHLQGQTGEGKPLWPSPVRLRMGEGGRRPDEGPLLRQTKLQRLDGIKILNAAAHALGGVEQHIGFR